MQAGSSGMVQGVRNEIIAMLAAKKRRFSAADYQLLGQEGILHEDDRVELIEVADSRLEREREKTMDTYAKCNVYEVRIANLIEDCMERYHSPAEGGYGEVSRFTRGDANSPGLCLMCS